MKPLSEVTQVIAPNRVKTWFTAVGLDYAIPPTDVALVSYSTETLTADRFIYKIGPVACYATDPARRFGMEYPVGSGEFQAGQFKVRPYLQTATFPAFSMTHLPDPAALDGIRAAVSAVFVNPVVSGASTTLYDVLADADTLASTMSYGAQPKQKVLAVGSFFGLFSKVYLPETLTREAWAGMPFLPFESPDFARPEGSNPLTWNWRWDQSVDYWFLGRISSIESVGETITVKATNQETGFEWPRISDRGSFEPSRGERIPLIYGEAKRFSVPILSAPYSSSLATQITDRQTEGIRISPPFERLPPNGNIWIGGEALSYQDFDETTGELVGVSRGPASGVAIGSAAFHNAGERVFVEGVTTLVVGDEGTTSIRSIYVRTNQGNVPTRVPSSFYSTGVLYGDSSDVVGVPVRVAQFAKTGFKQMVQYYQRANVTRQPVIYEGDGLEMTETTFGPDDPDPAYTSPWEATFATGSRKRDLSDLDVWEDGLIRYLDTDAPLFPVLDIEAEDTASNRADLQRQMGDWLRSGDAVFSMGVDLWQLSHQEVGDAADKFQGSSVQAPPDWVSGDVSGDLGFTSGWCVRFDSVSSTSAIATLADDWLAKVSFAYTLTVDSIGSLTSQNFDLGIAQGADHFYDTDAGDVLGEVIVTSAGNYEFAFTLDAKQGTRVSDLDDVVFAIFPGNFEGRAIPEFSIKLDDSTTRNAITGSIFHTSSATETTVTGAGVQDHLDSDYGTLSLWRSGANPGFARGMNLNGVYMNTFTYDRTAGELTCPGGTSGQWEESRASTPSYDDPYSVTIRTKPDLSALGSPTTTCERVKIEVFLDLPWAAADQFLLSFNVDPLPRGGEEYYPTKNLPPQSGLVERSPPLTTADASKKVRTLYRFSLGVEDQLQEIPLQQWDDDEFRIDVTLGNSFNFAGFDNNSTGYPKFIDGIGGGSFGDNPAWLWKLSDTIDLRVVWEFVTSTETIPPGRQPSSNITPTSIVANPGAFELEFFADASGPLASDGTTDSPEPQKPNVKRSEIFQDLQDADTDNYGPGTVVVNPTDILKRWIQRSNSVFQDDAQPDNFEVDYSDVTDSENLNDHYRALSYDSTSPYVLGFDARTLGSDWESVLARIAWECRTNVIRVSRSEVSGNRVASSMPFRFLTAGMAGGEKYSWGSSVAQIVADDVLAYDDLGKRATEIANASTAFYDTDDSRLGDPDNPTRFRKLAQRAPGGRVIQEAEFIPNNSDNYTGIYNFTDLGGYTSFGQTAATSAIWVEFGAEILGAQMNSIVVSLRRRQMAASVNQNSTFLGALSYLSDEYPTWTATTGVTGSPIINYTDLGLGDPTDPGFDTETGEYPVEMVFDLDNPPAAYSTEWAAFKTAWDAETIRGLRIQLDSTLGSNPSGYIITSFQTRNGFEPEAYSSAERLGVRPATFQLEAHRLTPGETYSKGAEDWLEYMTEELAKDSRLVQVVVRTDAGWHLELGDIVTCDVPAQIIDEGVTPVAGTVTLRLVGVSRTEAGVALRGVVI